MTQHGLIETRREETVAAVKSSHSTTSGRGWCTSWTTSSTDSRSIIDSAELASSSASSSGWSEREKKGGIDDGRPHTRRGKRKQNNNAEMTHLPGRSAVEPPWGSRPLWSCSRYDLSVQERRITVRVFLCGDHNRCYENREREMGKKKNRWW